MKQGKKLVIFLLTLLYIFTFTGCGENGDFVVYGRFKNNYTANEFDVFCDWDTINPLLDKCNFEEYGLYTNFLDNDDSFLNHEKKYNSIKVYSFPSVDGILNHDKPGSADISYGAIWYNSLYDRKHYGEQYFKEPMIEIYLYHKAKKDIEPDYLPGYRAVYSLDGDLALEEGQWFLEEDKDKFCRHYFEIMLKVIGKG